MKLARAALVGGAAALTAWAVARRRREVVAPVHHTGRAARNVTVAGLGAKVGTSYAVHRARRVFASAPRRVELDAEHELRTAAQEDLDAGVLATRLVNDALSKGGEDNITAVVIRIEQ